MFRSVHQGEENTTSALPTIPTLWTDITKHPSMHTAWMGMDAFTIDWKPTDIFYKKKRDLADGNGCQIRNGFMLGRPVGGYIMDALVGIDRVVDGLSLR